MIQLKCTSWFVAVVSVTQYIREEPHYNWLKVSNVPCLFCFCVPCEGLTTHPTVGWKWNMLLELTNLHTPQRHCFGNTNFLFSELVWEQITFWIPGCLCLFVPQTGGYTFKYNVKATHAFSKMHFNFNHSFTGLDWGVMKIFVIV